MCKVIPQVRNLFQQNVVDVDDIKNCLYKLECFEVINSHCRCETIHGRAAIHKNKNCNLKIESFS